MYESSVTTYTAEDIRNKIDEEKIGWIYNIGASNNVYCLKHYSSNVTDSNFTNNGTDANFFIIFTQANYSAIT